MTYCPSTDPFHVEGEPQAKLEAYHINFVWHLLAPTLECGTCFRHVSEPGGLCLTTYTPWIMTRFDYSATIFCYECGGHDGTYSGRARRRMEQMTRRNDRRCKPAHMAGHDDDVLQRARGHARCAMHGEMGG